jgi:hypothetical protein
VDVGRDAQVTVVRTGGVTGVRLEATIAWGDLDPEAQAALARLLDADEHATSPGVDRLAYEVVVREAGAERRCVAGEDARHAAEAVLRAARR